MMHDRFSELFRANIKSLFYDHQKPLVHPQSHLRILLEKPADFF